MDDQEKNEKLNNILRELSRSDNFLKESDKADSFYRQLEEVYYSPTGKKFHPFHSAILFTLSLIATEIGIGNLEILAGNLEAIKNGYKDKNKDAEGRVINIKKEICELYENINLEIVRINCTKQLLNDTQSAIRKNQNYMEEFEASISEKINNCEKTIDDFSEKVDGEVKQATAQFEEKFAGWQRENISILGIFAAIVLAFTGGMTFSSSVLQNIHQASVYRILIVALIIGFIFFNTIWALIDFLLRIINKNIESPKQSVTLGGQIFSLVNGFIVLGILFTWFAYCIMEI